MKLAVIAALLTTSAFGQVVITDSGSTNRTGMSITLGARDHAMVEDRRGTKAKMKLEAGAHSKLIKDLENAGPLDQLPARHCMKSVSFGSSTFITYNGVRSPDLSCSGQTDPAVIALQKDVEPIMNQARAKVPSRPRY